MIILTKATKITAIALVAALTIGAGVFAVGAKQKPKEQENVRQREYTVAKGDITVGIDGAGKLFTNSRGYKLPKNIEVRSVKVKVGDKIKKGDILFEISDLQGEKCKELAKEQAEKIKERLTNLEEDKNSALNNINWQLENRKYKTEDEYWNKRWKLNNKIYNLEDELSEAVWKRDWLEDNELTRDTVTKLEKELAAAKADREAHDLDRETQQQQEKDPEFQKKLQQEKLADLESRITQVKKELASAEKRVETANKTIITAVNDGVVAKVNTESGAKTGDSPVVEIGEDKEIKVKITIEPEDIVDITNGQEAEIYVDAFPETALKGNVERRVLSPDDAGKFAAVLKIGKNDFELLAGMTASGTVIVKQKKNVLTISNKAVELKDGKQYVKIRSAQGKLEEIEITTGFSDGKISEVLSGVKEGEVVIKESEV